MIYDSIEPLDPVGIILRGLSGSEQAKAENDGAGWQSAYEKLHKMATSKDRVLMVPEGMTPRQIWEEGKNEW